MTDDLISRSELRKRFQAILDRGDMFCEYDIIGMVDNAPTVCNDNYAMGYQDGVKKVLSERPQGEWGKWIISVIQCPDCLECFNFPTKYYPMEMLKECPNCGADMRGGRE